MNLPSFFGFNDHADADAVFHAAAGIETLELGRDLGLATSRDFVEVDQRRAADQFGDVLSDLQRLPPMLAIAKA